MKEKSRYNCLMLRNIINIRAKTRTGPVGLRPDDAYFAYFVAYYAYYIAYFAYCNMHNMQNMDVALLFCILFCRYMQAFAYWCIYMQNNMHNMSNNMQAQNPICRIVQRPYFAYWSYICTPYFADGPQ